ncbi:hypothetical protein Hanom_Chr06g00546171 [Helianthus anomalus]
MSEFETPVVVTAEEEQLNKFVEGLFADPQESNPSKYPAHKKRKTEDGSSKDVHVEPTASTRAPPPPAPRRPRPFQSAMSVEEPSEQHKHV